MEIYGKKKMDTLENRIKAVKDKLDPRLRLGLIRVLQISGEVTLDAEILVMALGNPDPVPEGFKKISDGTYSGKCTYGKLLELAEERKFNYFEDAISYSK